MAGAGYKLFATGDVLTASDVNTYLQQQTVMVFDDAAARTTALTGVVSEGMVSYLKSTNVVEVYDGSSWVSSDDPNAIQNSIVNAKGDIIGASANDVPAITSVGSNGDTLVADSAATTGLRWQGNYAAGKNSIINGDFYWNQRNFSSITANGYGFDRWALLFGGGPTVTYSTQNFTPGTAPVAGYEGKTFARMATTTASAAAEYSILQQKVEDIRTLAGKTLTVSFWAKAASGTPKVGVELYANTGSGGSGGSSATGKSVTISTTWTRYSVTITTPSLSGATIGTSSNYEVNLWCSAGSTYASRAHSIGNQTATIDFWGVQVEAGSVATAFQTATGTIQGELAACQRYYFRTTTGNVYARFATGQVQASNTAQAMVYFPVTMRIAPTALEQTGTASNYALLNASGGLVTCNLTPGFDSSNTTSINMTLYAASGLTAGNATQFLSNNNSTAYIGWSAEL